MVDGERHVVGTSEQQQDPRTYTLWNTLSATDRQPQVILGSVQLLQAVEHLGVNPRKTSRCRSQCGPTRAE